MYSNNDFNSENLIRSNRSPQNTYANANRRKLSEKYPQLPLILQLANMVVLIGTFLYVWLPAQEMPYRPVLLLPALIIACMLWKYHRDDENKKMERAQVIWIVVLCVLIYLATIFPQRTCCERTAYETSMYGRWQFAGPGCEAESNEVNQDGVWTPKHLATRA